MAQNQTQTGETPGEQTDRIVDRIETKGVGLEHPSWWERLRPIVWGEIAKALEADEEAARVRDRQAALGWAQQTEQIRGERNAAQRTADERARQISDLDAALAHARRTIADLERGTDLQREEIERLAAELVVAEVDRTPAAPGRNVRDSPEPDHVEPDEDEGDSETQLDRITNTVHRCEDLLERLLGRRDAKGKRVEVRTDIPVSGDLVSLAGLRARTEGAFLRGSPHGRSLAFDFRPADRTRQDLQAAELERERQRRRSAEVLAAERLELIELEAAEGAKRKAEAEALEAELARVRSDNSGLEGELASARAEVRDLERTRDRLSRHLSESQDTERRSLELGRAQAVTIGEQARRVGSLEGFLAACRDYTEPVDRIVDRALGGKS